MANQEQTRETPMRDQLAIERSRAASEMAKLGVSGELVTWYDQGHHAGDESGGYYGNVDGSQVRIVSGVKEESATIDGYPLNGVQVEEFIRTFKDCFIDRRTIRLAEKEQEQDDKKKREAAERQTKLSEDEAGKILGAIIEATRTKNEQV